MNREELFKRLHEVFTGKPNEKSSTLLEYEKLSPEDGLKKAQAYLESAKRGQDNCKSDWSYWAYEGDITMAKLLIGVFKALSMGVTEFPEIPDLEGKVLMDKTAYLQGWATRLANRETWTCMVCGDERPDDKISVYSESKGDLTVNIRYCNDKPACIEGAPQHKMLQVLRE